jgi:hypothetical protein
MSVSPGTDLHGQLARWVAEGLIDAGQATRIEEAEAGTQQHRAPATAPRRVPLVVEALGYRGGVLAVVAAFIAVSQLWPGIPTSAQLTFAAVGAATLGIAAAVLVTGDDPAFRRLRSVLWSLSTASLAAFTGVLASEVGGFDPNETTLTLTAAALVYAAVLWWRTRAPLLQVTTFAYAAVLTGAAIATAGPGLGVWAVGLGVWGLSALWGAAAFRGYFVPRDVGYVVAGAGLLAGAQLMMQAAAGHVLALVTVAGLLAAGVALRRVWVLALGAIGVLTVVPRTVTRYLPPGIASPLAVLVVGLVLLGVALWLAKTRRTPKSR